MRCVPGTQSMLVFLLCSPITASYQGQTRDSQLGFPLVLLLMAPLLYRPTGPSPLITERVCGILGGLGA